MVNLEDFLKLEDHTPEFRHRLIDDVFLLWTFGHDTLVSLLVATLSSKHRSSAPPISPFLHPHTYLCIWLLHLCPNQIQKLLGLLPTSLAITYHLTYILFSQATLMIYPFQTLLLSLMFILPPCSNTRFFNIHQGTQNV